MKIDNANTKPRSKDRGFFLPKKALPKTECHCEEDFVKKSDVAISRQMVLVGTSLRSPRRPYGLLAMTSRLRTPVVARPFMAVAIRIPLSPISGGWFAQQTGGLYKNRSESCSTPTASRSSIRTVGDAGPYGGGTGKDRHIGPPLLYLCSADCCLDWFYSVFNRLSAVSMRISPIPLGNRVFLGS